MLAQLIPDPLHPALVHFPIVLLLLGAPVAIAAAITRRAHLPIIAAALLLLGALGSVLAVQTGGEEEEIVEDRLPNEAVLHQHEEWAERTNAAAITAALLGLAAVALGFTRRAVVAQALGIATACAALTASVCVVATGHFGGRLVYQQGAGIHPALNADSGGATPADSAPRRRHRDDDDDDDDD